jgi:diguanylate cyclase (GGDEF)-like protein
MEVGPRLRNGIRVEDFVGHYGGEEFAIVLCDCDLEDAGQIGERLRASIADTPFTYECCQEYAPAPGHSSSNQCLP